MKTENAELTKMARESLKGKWWLAVGTFFLYTIILGVPNAIPVLGSIVALIIGGPMALGLAIFVLSISRGKDANLEQIFQGFHKFGNSLGAYLLMVLFILLWSLLLIIPGIIAAFSYSMTFFILADDEENIGAMDALNKSKGMMMGHKGKLFCLSLRFIGWALLCILTAGIGYFWLAPYMEVSFAKFYDDIKADYVTEIKSEETV